MRKASRLPCAKAAQCAHWVVRRSVAAVFPAGRRRDCFFGRGRTPPLRTAYRTPCVIRAGRCGHRPLHTFYRKRVRYPCGAMHPKGTCSASLHCVGIAPTHVLSEACASSVRADVGIRPYARSTESVCYPCGAMHPKGTCSASLHCVGIRPYIRLPSVRSVFSLSFRGRSAPVGIRNLLTTDLHENA